VIYLDTSAFLKLYIREAGSEFVQEIVTSQDDPLPVWDLLQAEVINALRLKVFWQDIRVDEANRLIKLFDERLQRGQYFVPEVDRHVLLSDSRSLGEHTPQTGCRTMDILHVACALQTRPVHFLSFDGRQRDLATLAGLAVLPEELSG
jgi:predicted nucleic acid-binding protein